MKLTKNGLDFYCSEQMNGIDGLIHGFSSRAGGVSKGVFASLNFGLSDDPECVTENYRRACEALGITRMVVGTQQHTAVVREVTERDAGTGLSADHRFADGVDGLVTDRVGLGLGVLGADCPGVLLCDPKTHSIGAVHSGWRGTVAGIAAIAAKKMHDRYGARFEDLYAVVGPCIRSCCFETGLEVAEQFERRYGAYYPKIGTRRGDKAFLDLPAAISYDLAALGVTNICVLEHCTMCENDRFFSHRKGDRGRICGMIAWKEENNENLMVKGEIKDV